MNFLGLSIVAKTQKRDDNPILNEAYWTQSVNYSSSGAAVTPETATSVPSVYAAVNRISSTIASLPLILYRRKPDGGKERATDLQLYEALNLFPNYINTRSEFFTQVGWHLLLRGNFYAHLQFTRGRYIMNPLNPDYVSVKQIKGSLAYTYWEPGKQKIEYVQGEILHIRGHSEDGILGKSPIQIARETIGLAQQEQRYSSSMLENGTKLSGVLEHPETLDDAASKRLTESFRKAYSGAANSGKVAVLEEGMKFHTISMTNADAQFVESKKLTITDIARIFQIPPHMIGDLERSTNNNIEQQSLEYVIYTILPWAVRIEQAIHRDVISFGDRNELFVKFAMDGLLRGDFQSRMNGYNIGLQSGVLRFNDARNLEDLDPYEWGDASMVPMNMAIIRDSTDIDRFMARPDKNQQPAPTPVSKKSFVDVVEETVRAGAVTIQDQFERIVRREKTALCKPDKSSEQRQKRVRDFLSNHKDFVTQELVAPVTALERQLSVVARLFEKKTSALDDKFLTEWVQRYVTLRAEAFYEVEYTEPERAFATEVVDPASEATCLAEDVAKIVTEGAYEPWIPF